MYFKYHTTIFKMAAQFKFSTDCITTFLNCGRHLEFWGKFQGDPQAYFEELDFRNINQLRKP